MIDGAPLTQNPLLFLGGQDLSWRKQGIHLGSAIRLDAACHRQHITAGIHFAPAFRQNNLIIFACLTDAE